MHAPNSYRHTASRLSFFFREDCDPSIEAGLIFEDSGSGFRLICEYGGLILVKSSRAKPDVDRVR